VLGVVRSPSFQQRMKVDDRAVATN